jgi:hypothetical protein
MEQPEAKHWTDSLYCTNQVWWQWRFDNGLNADGIIFGFIEKEPRGVVVEFEHNVKWRSRYFVTLAHLEQTWCRRDGTFYITKAQRLEMHDQPEPYEDLTITSKGKACVRDVCSVILNRRRVPVWTQFR